MLKVIGIIAICLMCGCPKKDGDTAPPVTKQPVENEKPNLTCEKDDDCDLITIDTNAASDDYCCDVCDQSAANAGWIDDTNDRCSKVETDQCPELRCSEMNMEAKCVDNVCKAVEKKEAEAAAFPAIDTTCTTDDECSLTTVGWKNDYCCSKCDSWAVSTKWIQEVNKVCQAQMDGKDYHDRCPHLSCRQSPEQIAACVDGKCTAKLAAKK